MLIGGRILAGILLSQNVVTKCSNPFPNQKITCCHIEDAWCICSGFLTQFYTLTIFFESLQCFIQVKCKICFFCANFDFLLRWLIQFAQFHFKCVIHDPFYHIYEGIKEKIWSSFSTKLAHFSTFRSLEDCQQ